MTEENETGIGFVERRVTGERTGRAYAMRQARARLEDSLSGPMLDAEREIEKAFRAVTEAHYGQRSPEGPQMTEEDYAKWLAEQQTRLKDWTSACPVSSKGVVLDHIVFAFTFTEIGFQRCITRKTVSARYRIGLNEWCIMRGWGSQFSQP